MKEMFKSLLAIMSVCLVFASCSEYDYNNPPKENNAQSATRNGSGVDYLHIDGTYVVFEGNMLDVNGTLVYYDENGIEHSNIYENANSTQIGNVVQDMYIHNGRTYLLTQNGNRLQGDGRFVVCNASTMRKIYADPLIINIITSSDTILAWPQHLIVVNDTLAYVQYSTSDNEANSGICKLVLSDTAVQVKETVAGTYGTFGSQGASKMRLVYSRGKIYAGRGNSVVIIDPITASVEKTIPFANRQVKGIVKAADNNIYIALSGEFTGLPNLVSSFSSYPRMVAINHAGTIVSDNELKLINLPVAGWMPAINMCASFTKPYLYFVDTDDFAFKRAARYNYKTKKFDKNYIPGNETIYGIMGEHPRTNNLWVGKSNYVTSDIYEYEVVADTLKQKQHFHYSTRNYASPAGVDFVYRFSPTFINR